MARRSLLWLWFSWGRNQNGQLGLGTNEDASVPQKVRAFEVSGSLPPRPLPPHAALLTVHAEVAFAGGESEDAGGWSGAHSSGHR